MVSWTTHLGDHSSSEPRFYSLCNSIQLNKLATSLKVGKNTAKIFEELTEDKYF